MVYYLCHMGLHCGAYYSNCAVIGHSTCQTAASLGWVGCYIVTSPFSSLRGWGLGTRLAPGLLAQLSIACIFVCT